MGVLFAKRFKNPHAKTAYLSFREEYESLVKKRSKLENSAFLPAIERILQNSPQLVREFNLLLSGIGVADTGALVISRVVIKPDIRILKIDLESSRMSVPGAKALGAMLDMNDCLEILQVSENNLGTAGAVAVLNGLRNNRRLKKLMMNNVGAGHEVYHALAELMTANRTLEHLEVEGALLAEEGMADLLEAFKSNFTLGFLQFSSELAPVEVESIIAACERNLCCTDIIKLLLAKCVQRQFKTKMNTFKRSVKQRAGEDARGEKVDFKVLATMKSREDNALKSIESRDKFGEDPESEKKRFRSACAEMMGRRAEMQDVSRCIPRFRNLPDEDVFMLYDGHGSREAAKYCALNFPDIFVRHLAQHSEDGDVFSSFRSTWMELNRQVSPWSVYSGTTALCAYVQKRKIYCSNVGDSRCVLCRGGEAIRLSLDHRPELAEEAARIKASGGFVKDKRVNGLLSVSRAIGDSFLQPFVSCEPHTTALDMVEDDQFLILACDGVFDVLSDEQAVALVATERNALVAAEKLRDNAFDAGSGDNISVVVVFFDR